MNSRQVERIPYILKRKKGRRRISLVVAEEGVRVTAPACTSQREIDALLVRHDEWIRRKLSEWEMRLGPRLAWRSGDRIMVLGEPVLLDCDAACDHVERRAGTLFLPAYAVDNPSLTRQHAVAWLRNLAQVWFEARAAFYASILRVKPLTIRLTDAKTRWGTCHPNGRISLNWRLIQMPLPLLDYVVVHELAHLRVPNHSSDFWYEVARVLPDYAVRRRALRCDGLRYVLR